MASIGVNVDRAGRHDPAVVRGLGATWIRIVAMPDIDLSVYFRNCRQAGLKILLVLAKESGGDYARYQRLYGALVDAVQVGNEPDLDSPSSWTLSQGELVALGKAARAAFPFTPLVCAGLASGHPEWLDGADLSWCEALAFHPYLKDAPSDTDLEDLPDVDGLVRAYQRFGKPLLMTEWGWWGSEEGRATEEVRDMVRWAGRTGDVEVFFYFCADDAMVPPFGLLDAKGKPKGRATAFKEQAPLAIHSLWPTVAPEPPPAGPAPWAWWTPEQLAAAAACPLPAVRENWPRLVEQMTHAGIYGRMVALAMIGTIAKESASTFRPIHEYRNADGSIPSIWLTYDGGPEFHGRGFIQITHRSNYARYSIAVSELWGTEIVPDPQLDLVAVPDRALDPDISAAVAACYFRDHANGALLLAARNGQWDQVRRYVLGGPDPEGTARIARIAAQLGTAGPDVPAIDPKDELIAAYETALKTLRDATLPAVQTALANTETALDEAQRQLDECRRIVTQMAPV